MTTLIKESFVRTALSEVYPENVKAIPEIVQSLLIENIKKTIPISNTTFQITNALQWSLQCGQLLTVSVGAFPRSQMSFFTF